MFVGYLTIVGRMMGKWLKSCWTCPLLFFGDSFTVFSRIRETILATVVGACLDSFIPCLHVSCKVLSLRFTIRCES